MLNRSEIFAKILECGVREGEINLDNITLQEAIGSQKAGIRQRRNGLNARLSMKKKSLWSPRKRKFSPKYDYNFSYKIVQFIRIKLCQKSKEIYLEQELLGLGLRYFKSKLWIYPFILWAINFPKRCIRKLMSLIKT